MEKLKHIIRTQDFDHEFLESLFKRTSEIKNELVSGKYPYSFSDSLNGRILASLFYEESTRTRFSFESAMLRLGGEVVGTEAAKLFSSATKGESLEDTIRIVDNYAHVIVLRHKQDDAAEIAAKYSEVPVINAGSGKGHHPTQTLLDLYTINEELGGIDGKKIAMIGDLANGRTVRSLAYILTKFKDVEIIFIAPENLKMKDDIKKHLREHKIKFSEKSSLEEVLPYIDIAYITRIQKERMSWWNYRKSRGKYKIGEKELNLMKKDARLMHPLPHVEEICLSPEIEQTDIRVAYFRQADNGLYVRMALLEYLLK
ncbi:aspartate carbamoyltransferase [Candidatus Pacearchaeota archaeon]|nr:aspartate carbamoyltransferase [Candidatus Pacearchaeota archaeon]